jgi:hypothetical protein
MKYLIEVHQKLIATGLTPKQVKFSTPLPILCDASVTGIIEVYDFMTGPVKRPLVKKVKLTLGLMSMLIYLSGLGKMHHQRVESFW